VGYWWVSALTYLSGPIALGLILKEDMMSHSRHFSALMIEGALLLFVMLTRLWSKRLREFLQRVNGKCPLCLSHRCCGPRNAGTWTCPGCYRTVAWVTQTYAEAQRQASGDTGP
jgi:hypothetical protein